ncbi:autophagy-related protein 13b-like [Bidens hawaiensis]|uniref:autophagy-related protein 13b-like n=1 Tax=Bidens hawaiensis TaxID=980011 RepID=UPI00404A1B73
MVVDVVLVQRPWKSDSDDFGCGDGNGEKVIKRWIMRYETKKGCKEGYSGNKRSLNTITSHALYKKSILLLRSLYVTVRLLPGYKIFREVNSCGQIRSFSLVHRVYSSVEPLVCRDEGEMQQFVFTPVDTSCGKLCISLLYLPSITDTSSESSTPMSPQFITDYVGSLLADPLKRLPSASSSPFGRRHSWSYDTCMVSPPSAFPSPSPTYSESRTLYSKFGTRRPPIGSRYPSLEPVQVHTKDIGYDEYLPSPNFSLSPSPSPPVGTDMLKVLLQSDSAPVYIPALSSNKTIVPFSPPPKVTRPSLSLVERSLSIPTSSSKLLSLREEDTSRPSGVKISTDSSPHKSSFRSLSRLSFEDSYDDSEFSCPFVVDDDDIIDPGSRPGLSDRSRNLGTQHEQHERVKSQDAAVGALVQMLKKAPPLQQDLNRSQYVSKASIPEKPSNQIQDHAPRASSNMSSFSSVSGMKTTSDALEELKGYVDVKQVLLKQSVKP